MQQAVIVDAVRTPMGRYGGALKDVRPDDLAALVVAEAVRRVNLDPASIEDVYFGAANQAGEDNRNVARMAVLLADLMNRADVGMIESRSGAGFATKAFKGLRVASDIVGQELEGHEAAEFRVFCFVDDAHAAATELLQNAVVRDGLADERVRAGHVQHILGCARRQVNEEGAACGLSPDCHHGTTGSDSQRVGYAVSR